MIGFKKWKLFLFKNEKFLIRRQNWKRWLKMDRNMQTKQNSKILLLWGKYVSQEFLDDGGLGESFWWCRYVLEDDGEDWGALQSLRARVAATETILHWGRATVTEWLRWLHSRAVEAGNFREWPLSPVISCVDQVSWRAWLGLGAGMLYCIKTSMSNNCLGNNSDLLCSWKCC